MDNTQPYGTPGTMVIVIGVLHQLVGVAAGVGLMPAPDGRRSGPLIELFASGFVGQADAEPMRLAMVWFLLFGFMLIFSGVLLQRVPASRGLAVGFGALCGLGVLLMPASGFWLGFIPAVQLWRQTKRGQPLTEGYQTTHNR